MHFFSSTISGIQEYAAKHDYSIMICQSMESLRTEKSNIHMLVSNRVDGLLISLSSQTKNVEHLEHLLAKQIPIVLFDRVTSELDVSKVVVDDYNGGFKAAEHLIRTGCKRIAFINEGSAFGTPEKADFLPSFNFSFSQFLLTSSSLFTSTFP